MAEYIDLVVPNITEFNLRHPTLGTDPGLERTFLEVGDWFTDQAVLWTEGPAVLLMADGFDRQWFDDLHEVLGRRPPAVVSPRRTTGLLLRDTLADAETLRRLQDRLAGHQVVRFRSFGASPELYRLAAIVRSWGHRIELDVPTEQHYWASLYLESKMSCLDLAGYLPGFRVPRGVTVGTWAELTGAVARILAEADRVIVKAMHGVGGEGSAVIDTTDASLEKFWQATEADPFLRSFPLSVQEYVEHAPEFGCPAVDVLIDENGVAEMVGSVLTVDEHRYRNLTIGAGVLDRGVEKRILDLGHQVAALASAWGYRGWFGIDCVLSRDDLLYVTEINARRTGAIQAIELRRTAGSTGSVAYSHDTIRVRDDAPVSYTDVVRPIFRELWRDGVKAFPTTVRALDHHEPMIGLVTVASTAAEAERIATGIRADLGDIVADRGGPLHPVAVHNTP